MTIPDAAIEAAAEAIREAWPADFSARLLARAAIEAAMPAIREAQRADTESLIREATQAAIDAFRASAADALQTELDRAARVMYGGYRDGYVAAVEDAARIVRGGTP